MKLKNKDMKHLKYVILMLLASCSLVACNSEDMDYDIDYTAIHPLGGQYIVTVSKDGADMGMMYCTIANTVSNDVDKCWVRVGSVTVADKISFTYTTSKDPGATYSVVGWRYTGWPEDDM